MHSSVASRRWLRRSLRPCPGVERDDLIEGGEKRGGESIDVLSALTVLTARSFTVRKKNRNVVAGHGSVFLVASVLVDVEVCRRLEGEPKGVSS